MQRHRHRLQLCDDISLPSVGKRTCGNVTGRDPTYQLRCEARWWCVQAIIPIARDEGDPIQPTCR